MRQHHRHQTAPDLPIGPPASPGLARADSRRTPKSGIGASRLRGDGFLVRPREAMSFYAGWKMAIVLPSGSLNHADRPIGVVAMWFTVLKVGVS
jgi:hypothetical protein